jgi:eukaryotic-like serine/threonine-protein kinase
MSDRELFLELLDQPDAAARGRLLDQHCAADADRRQRIERLYRAHGQAGSFLEGSLEEIAPTLLQSPTGSAPACHVGPGTVLAGRYSLVRPIGRGGMGVVWVAEQSEPVARQVAIKLIRPDLDSASTFARFAIERQTLAMMDHPNIAKVFDGGTTEDGRPFVVMELVEGVPITRHCDDARLGLDERLELFITVCRAIHHAHQKGIIHRDLKPSNVLIARQDGEPVPKIIDFGVAKTTHGRLDALGTCTGQGDVIGTPQYWSPEQAGLNPHDVDTRSDIYGLGLLLYELLAGRPPFAVESGGAVGIVELVRAIRENDPPPPSATVPVAALAAARRLTPERLVRRLRGDLDWIAMKCLEKDRNRRYESADGLAAELERHLADEPVAAGPPSPAYRLRKLARKHRRPLAAAAALALAMVVGSVGTTLGMVRAARAEAEAREHERVARERFVLAQSAVDSFLASVTDDKELKRADHHELRLRLLASAIPFYQQLAAERPNDSRQLLAQAVAFGRFADLARETGDSETARQSLDNAERILRRLIESPDPAGGALELAKVKRRQGDLAADRGDNAAARSDYRTAAAILQGLVDVDPTLRPAVLELARTHNNDGLLPDTANGESFERAILLLDDFLARTGSSNESLELQSVCLNNLGNHFVETGRHRDARETLERAIRITERLAEDDPLSPTLIQKRAGLQANLARVLEVEGNLPAARRGMEEAAAALKALADRQPRHADYRLQWAGVENNAAMLQTETGDPTGALARHEKLVAFLNGLSHRPSGLFGDLLANAHAGRAGALQRLHRDADAADAWRAAIEHSPSDAKPLRESNYAVLLARMDRADSAREIAERLRDQTSKLVLYNLACVHAILHRRHRILDDADRAMRFLAAAVARGYTQKNLIERDPDLEGLRDRPDYRALVGRDAVEPAGTAAPFKS